MLTLQVNISCLPEILHHGSHVDTFYHQKSYDEAIKRLRLDIQHSQVGAICRLLLAPIACKHPLSMLCNCKPASYNLRMSRQRIGL